MPCILFDLDGTLVDSETLGSRALLELLPQLDASASELLVRYRGMKMAAILADLEHRLGEPLPRDFEPVYRAHVATLFDRSLTAMPGAAPMLAALPFPRCVASSGPRAKIEHALQVTGLRPHIGDRIFSAYEVGSWKPDPGLFLHAAAAMGFTPAQCIVVEDSEVGLAAAEAAGMRAIHFVGDAHTRTTGRHPAVTHHADLIDAIDALG